ncbi:MAG: DUF6468 domain-containing protein [Hyphomicrobiales bacterium]
MEYFSFAYLLEYLLIILFVVGVYYMASVNKKLKMLKSGGDGFKAVVIELNHATENAKTAIQGLKLTVRDAEHGLDGNLRQARSVTEELKYLLSQANGPSEGLYAANPRNVPLPSENLRHVPQPAVRQNRAKNFADQTLEKVAKQKQSLPNPIIHNPNNRNLPDVDEPRIAAADDVNLGMNIPAEHREMALQRREEALKAIAEKNSQQNRQRTAPRPATRPEARPMRQAQPPQMQNRSDAPHRNAQRAQPGLAPQRAPMPSQPTSQQQAPRQQVPRQQAPHNPLSSPDQQRQKPQMSLSDMVGRHADLERKSFTAAEPQRAEPQVRNEVESPSDKRKSLFQKLSRTR